MGETGDRPWAHRRVATSAPFFPRLPGGLACGAVGKGEPRPPVSLLSTQLLPCFLGSQMEKRVALGLDSLTASLVASRLQTPPSHNCQAS